MEQSSSPARKKTRLGESSDPECGASQTLSARKDRLSQQELTTTDNHRTGNRSLAENGGAAPGPSRPLPAAAAAATTTTNPPQPSRQHKMKDDEFYEHVTQLCRLSRLHGTDNMQQRIIHASSFSGDRELEYFVTATLKEHAKCRVKLGTKGKHTIYGDRMDYALSWLNEDRVELLDRVGFPWPASALDDASFQRRLVSLANYKEEHGNLLVPMDYRDHDLVTWMEQTRQDEVKLMQKKRKNANPNNAAVSLTGLTLDRRAILDALGFEWVYGKAFQQRIKELQHYTNTHGTSTTDMPKPLAGWLGTMKANHRAFVLGNFKGSELEEKKAQRKIVLLKQHVPRWFDDANIEKPVTWDDRFKELAEFHKSNGHCIVPQHYADNRQLGKWVNSQRKRYSEQKPNSSLTPERIHKLERLGFCWKVRDRFFDREWDHRLGALRDFYDKYGDCNVPSDWKEDPLLAKWVTRVRDEYEKFLGNKTSKLNLDRIQKLEDLGFDF